MRLPPLKLLEWTDVRVLIVETDNHTDGDQRRWLVEMIEERSTVGVLIQRPTYRVLHQAWLVIFRLNLPNLLQAYAKAHRLALRIETEFLRCDFRQMTATSLSEDCAACVKLHASCEVVFGRAVFPDSIVLRCNSFETSVVVEEEL